MHSVANVEESQGVIPAISKSSRDDGAGTVELGIAMPSTWDQVGLAAKSKHETGIPVSFQLQHLKNRRLACRWTCFTSDHNLSALRSPLTSPKTLQVEIPNPTVAY
eukprot:2974387-Amphidinium_carterae.2